MSGLSGEELERMRRSIAMLAPGTMTLPREDAMALLTESLELRHEIQALRLEMQALRELAAQLPDQPFLRRCPHHGA